MCDRVLQATTTTVANAPGKDRLRSIRGRNSRRGHYISPMEEYQRGRCGACKFTGHGWPGGHLERAGGADPTVHSLPLRDEKRGTMVWLGGLRPCDDAAAVTNMMAPFEVRNVTLRRKGWRNSQTRERIGFALVQLASEEAVEAALAHFKGSHLDVRPHRWQPPSSEQLRTDGEDPLAPLLGEGSSTAAALGDAASTGAADEPPGMPTLEEQLEPLTISQARLRLQRFGCGSNELAAAEARAQQQGGRVMKKACLISLLCRLHRTAPERFPRRVSRAAGYPLASSVLAPLLTELRGTKWPLKKGRNVDAAHYLVLVRRCLSTLGPVACAKPYCPFC